jgi:hypothetical protein
LLFVPSGPPTDVPVKAGTEDGLLKLGLVPSAAPTAVPVKPGDVEGAVRLAFGAAADELPARTAALPAALAPMVVFGPAPVAVAVVRPAVVLGPAPVVAGTMVEPTLPFGPAPVAVVGLAAEAGVSVAGRVADALAALGRVVVGLPLAATLVRPTFDAIPLEDGPPTAAPMISSYVAGAPPPATVPAGDSCASACPPAAASASVVTSTRRPLPMPIMLRGDAIHVPRACQVDRDPTRPRANVRAPVRPSEMRP